MLINIENVGLIKSADIHINGLTVIAGENDTGKSTIGKLLFSILFSFNRYEDEFKDFRQDKIVRDLRSVMSQIRKDAPLSEPLVNHFSLRSHYAKFRNLIQKDNEEEFIATIEEYNYYLKLLNDKYKLKDYEQLKDLLGDSIKILFLKKSKDDLLRLALGKVLSSEFENELTNKVTRLPSHISFSEGNFELLKFSVENNRITNFKFINEPSCTDVTYIEDSMILNSKNSLLIKDLYTLRLKDLALKMEKTPISNSTDLLYETEIFNLIDSKTDFKKYPNQAISNIIGGSLEFDQDESSYHFSKNINKQDYKFKTTNVSTGIKNFGVLDMLIKNNTIKRNDLVIIDEPEVHLHPKWQIEYAKCICDLVNSGIYVIINTHSPYITEALHYYSSTISPDKVNFYLSNKISNYESIIEDVTSNLNKIYKKLSDPLENLIWERY